MDSEAIGDALVLWLAVAVAAAFLVWGLSSALLVWRPAWLQERVQVTAMDVWTVTLLGGVAAALFELGLIAGMVLWR